MLSAAAESTACLSDIEGELSITQRKSTFAARASRAAKSSASESVATTRAPVVLVIAFIVLLLLPAARRSRARRRWAVRARRVPRESGAQRDASARRGSQRRMIGCGVHARRARRICVAMAALRTSAGWRAYATPTPDAALAAASAGP